MGHDDHELAARGAAGDPGALSALYRAHAGRVKAYLLRSGFRPADADDLTQEVFVRAWRSLGTFDPERGRLAGWLAAIARNTARKHWRRRPDPEAFDPALAEATLAVEADPSTHAEAADELAAVRDCVGALPAELARIVRLRYVDGRSTRGVAQAVGMAEATVRLRLAEARDRLAQCLKGKGIVE